MTKPEIAFFPAKPVHVALYLAYLIIKCNTASPVEEAMNALSWTHTLACVEDPTQHPLVKQVLDSAKCILAHKVTKKEPITPEILKALFDKFGNKNASLSDIRALTIILLVFAGFFHYSELARLRECDITFYQDHCEIFLESSKTDQYRDGAVVVIARTGTECCPVLMSSDHVIAT